jgi:hypothetical protein
LEEQPDYDGDDDTLKTKTGDNKKLSKKSATKTQGGVEVNGAGSLQSDSKQDENGEALTNNGDKDKGGDQRRLEEQKKLERDNVTGASGITEENEENVGLGFYFTKGPQKKPTESANVIEPKKKRKTKTSENQDKDKGDRDDDNNTKDTVGVHNNNIDTHRASVHNTYGRANTFHFGGGTGGGKAAATDPKRTAVTSHQPAKSTALSLDADLQRTAVTSKSTALSLGLSKLTNQEPPSLPQSSRIGQLSLPPSSRKVTSSAATSVFTPFTSTTKTCPTPSSVAALLTNAKEPGSAVNLDPDLDGPGPHENLKLDHEKIDLGQTKNIKMKQYLCVKHALPKTRLTNAILYENVSHDRHLEMKLSSKSMTVVVITQICLAFDTIMGK